MIICRGTVLNNIYYKLVMIESCLLYNVLYTLYIIHYSLYNEDCVLHITMYMLHIIQRK